MNKIGTLQTRSSSQIDGSRIGIGFECLERKMWDDTDEVYRLTGELGVKHARVQTGWNLCEQEDGVFDFAWLDRIVDKLLAEGIQPWFNVGYGNILHTQAKEPDAVGWAPIRSDAEKTAWLRFVGKLVDHFRDRITHYEIWNEPDITPFWVGGPNPHEYMELLKLTVPVVKEHQPDAKIIGAAIARSLGIGGAAFLEEYLKDGMAELIDAYSYHRYHIVPELHRPGDVARLRAALQAHGGGHIELWQAESGCPSVPAPTQALANTPVSEQVQAKLAARSITTDLLHDLDYTCWFHLSDFKFYYRNGFCAVPNHFGLLTFDSPVRCKPSYHVVQRLCALFDSGVTLDPRGQVEFALPDMGKSPQKYAFQERIVSIKSGMFDNHGVPLATWWYPADMLPSVASNPPYQAPAIDVYLWSPNGTIQNPVIIDPMTGDVFEPAFEHSDICTGIAIPQLILHNVPLNDTPLYVTDRSAVRLT